MRTNTIVDTQRWLLSIVAALLLTSIVGCKPSPYYIRFEVDSLAKNKSISVRTIAPMSEELRSMYSAEFLERSDKLAESTDVFFDEFLRELSSSQLFSEVSLIDSDEKATTDWVFEQMMVIVFGGGLEKLAYGTPRTMAVKGTLVDAVQGSELMKFNQMASQFPWSYDYNLFRSLDPKLARQLSKRITKSLHSKMKAK